MLHASPLKMISEFLLRSSWLLGDKTQPLLPWLSMTVCFSEKVDLLNRRVRLVRTEQIKSDYASYHVQDKFHGSHAPQFEVPVPPITLLFIRGKGRIFIEQSAVIRIKWWNYVRYLDVQVVRVEVISDQLEMGFCTQRSNFLKKILEIVSTFSSTLA